jgi:hypothetical protein
LGIISPIEAVLLTSVGVLGHTPKSIEGDLGMATGSAQRSLRRARQALRTWLGVPAVLDSFASSGELPVAVPEPRYGLVSEPPRQLRLFDNERPSACPVTGTRQPVATGAST